MDCHCCVCVFLFRACGKARREGSQKILKTQHSSPLCRFVLVPCSEGQHKATSHPAKKIIVTSALIILVEMKSFITFICVLSSGAAGGGVAGFQSPGHRQLSSLRWMQSSPCRPSILSSSRTSLGISSSAPPEDEPEQQLEISAVSGETDEAERNNEELVDILVQAGLVLIAAGMAYAAAATVLSAVGSLTTTAVDGISKDAGANTVAALVWLWSGVSSLIVAIWGGLTYVLPIVFKVIHDGIEVALPVLREASSEAAVAAAPYMEQARSEVFGATAPYMEQFGGALQQVTDSAVVEPIQRATEALGKTVDSTILAPLQDFQRVVDSSLVAPVNEIKDSVANAVDTSLVTPINQAKSAVEGTKVSIENTIDASVFQPINQVKDSITTSIHMELPTTQNLLNKLPSSMFNGGLMLDKSASSAMDASAPDIANSLNEMIE